MNGTVWREEKQSIGFFRKLERKICEWIEGVMMQIEREGHGRIGVLPNFDFHREFKAMEMNWRKLVKLTWTFMVLSLSSSWSCSIQIHYLHPFDPIVSSLQLLPQNIWANFFNLKFACSIAFTGVSMRGGGGAIGLIVCPLKHLYKGP